MAVPENKGTLDELLTMLDDVVNPERRLKLVQWQYFRKLAIKASKSHCLAQCLGCEQKGLLVV